MKPKEYKPGIYPLSDEAYFAAEGINASGLKDILRSPAYFKERKENPKEPSWQMIDGTAMHCTALQPEEYEKRYVVLPDNAPLKPTEKMINDPNPKPEIASRVQFWNVFEKSAEGKIIVTQEKDQLYRRVGDMVQSHDELASILANGKAEQAIFAVDPVTKKTCKCKPDFLAEVGGYKIMLEFKTTDDARPDAFQRTAYNFGYYTSAAYYCDIMDWAGLTRPDVYFIVAAERDAPHGLKIYEVSEEALEYGERQYRKALNLYSYCTDMQEWPNYDTTIELLTLPGWVRNDEL